MLWNATTIKGFTVKAPDGAAGTAADILFDDTWIARCLLVDAGAAASVAMPVAGLAKPDAGAEEIAPAATPAPAPAPAYAGDTARLNSVSALPACAIEVTDGRFGEVEDVLVNDHDWEIRFLTVRREPGSDAKVMVARQAVARIDWPAKLIQLDVDAATVRAGPAYDAGISVDGADAEKSLSYLGIKWIDRDARPA